MRDSFTETTLTVGDQTLSVYKEGDDSDFYFVYGTNQDGVTGWFQYDNTDGSLQRVNEDLLSQDTTAEEPVTTAAGSDEYFGKWQKQRYLVAILLFVIVVLSVVIINLLLSRRRREEEEDWMDEDEPNDPDLLVGGRTFTALASQNLSLKELNNYPLISLSDESMTRAFYRQFFLDHGAVLKPDTEAATTDQMLTLVKSELGIAFLPQTMAQDALARGEIVQLHLQEIIPQRSICLVYDHHRPLNTAARKFQQMLTKAAPKCPEHR